MIGDIAGLRINKDESGGSGRPLAWVLIAFILGAGAGAAALHFIRPLIPQSGGEVVVQTVQAISHRDGEAGARSSFTAGGWIEAAFPWPRTVVSLVRGRIDKMHVQEGQAVKAGDVVAEIYSRDFDEQLAAARAGLEVEKSRLLVEKARLGLLRAGYRAQDVEEARAKLRELAAEVELWKSVSDRSRVLAAQGAVSSEQAQADLSAFETRKARHDAQKALLSKLEEGVRAEEIAMQAAEVAKAESLVADAQARVDIAFTALGYTVIRSQLDGVVFEVFRETGDSVNPGPAESSRVVSIYNPAELWAKADVSQADIAKVSPGQSAEIRTDASPKTYKGRVLRKNPLASFAKNTVEVKVEILEPDGMLHPDMTTRITFMPVASDGSEPGSTGPKGPPLVPPSAVLEEAGGHFVMVVADSFARKRAVTLGEEKDGKVQVLSGLRAGETVVSADPGAVGDGQRVRIAPAR